MRGKRSVYQSYGRKGSSPFTDKFNKQAGSLAERNMIGVVFTVDLLKRDMEAKVLLGCTADEVQIILAFHNGGPMSAILLILPRFGGQVG